MGIEALNWIAKAVVWAFLLMNALRNDLIRRYRLVFTMIISSMVLSVAMLLLSEQIGTGNMTYAIAWVSRSLLTAVITGGVAIQIYSIPGKISPRRDWHLVVVPIILVLLTFLDNERVWVYARVVSLTSLVVTYLGLAALVRTARCKRLDLGWNLKVVLLAVTVPSVFEYLVLTAYFMGLPLSYDSTRLWLKGASLATWIILALGMMEYSPPVLRTATGVLEGTEGDPLQKLQSSGEKSCITP